MKILFLTLFALFVGTFSIPTFDSSLNEAWKLFKQVYEKVYTFEEEQNRRAIWEENVATIRVHNLEADMDIHSYTLGMNKYGDMTNKEFVKQMNGLKMTDDSQSGDRHTFIPPSNVKIPASVDWRKEGYVTPVKDQGQCGSCWAFSATGSLEGQWFKAHSELISLSEQNLVDCSTTQGNQGCNGGWMDWAFQYIKDNEGIDTEKSYPYHAVDQKCQFDKKNIGANDTGFTDIKAQSEPDLEAAIATVGPISVAIDASHAKFQLYKSGVYDQLGCSTTQLDHGVLAVGYDTTSKKQNYYIVKNSWGESWGNHGYIWMSRDKKNQCGIATKASYPIV